MASEVIELVSLGVSGFVLILSLTVFHLSRRKISKLESEIANISDKQSELRQIEKHVLEKDPDYEDFERTIANLSEKLFSLVQERYEFEGVTTYEEMIDALENLDSDDEIIDDLITFFRYLEEIEYSEREVSEEDKALIRQAAFRLLRRSGPALEELEDHRKLE